MDMKTLSPNLNQDSLYDKTIQTIGAVSKLPVISVDREKFLSEQFAESPYLKQILAGGPQSVYSTKTLQEVAYKVINQNTKKSTAVSFAAGIVSNPAAMIATGGADVAQYFGFAINMAQKIAYLFGEDDLFDNNKASDLSEEANMRIISYLGVMFGASGATGLITKLSRPVGEQLGKRVTAQALTKTIWYPTVKKVGALLGKEITKKTVAKTVSKAVPVIGGVISGGLTYVTFKPMGKRLADVFVKNLNGELDDGKIDFELNSKFAESLNKVHKEDTNKNPIVNGNFSEMDLEINNKN